VTLGYNAAGDARIEVDASVTGAHPSTLIHGWTNIQHWFALAGLETLARGACTSVGSIRTLTVVDVDGETYKVYGTCTHYSTTEWALTERFRFSDMPGVRMTVTVWWSQPGEDMFHIRVDVPLGAVSPESRAKFVRRLQRLNEALEVLLRYLGKKALG
jgi:hypothetical protein